MYIAWRARHRVVFFVFNVFHAISFLYLLDVVERKMSRSSEVFLFVAQH